MQKITRNEYFREDGHIPRDQDAIEDDIQALATLKESFLTVLNRASTKADSSSVEQNFIGIEQGFDDMLFSRWEALSEELGYDPEYPQSARLTAWNRQQFKRRF